MSSSGFTPELLKFLSELRGNNSREWFQAHRQEYEQHLLEPAREFVITMGGRLHTLAADIHAEPRIHGSIFAINRDTRFSADKTPYKTHLDLWFWQGDGPSRGCPGYFFRLTPESLLLGAGMHAFSADGSLQRYRQAVLDPERCAQLEHATTNLQSQLKGRTYQRVPQGLPKDHPRAQWLCFSGLYAEVTLSPAPLGNDLPELCLSHFQRFAPLQRWLVDLLSAG